MYDTSNASGGTQYYTAAGASARTWNKTADTSLYGRWTANTYNISYVMHGGTYGTNHPTSATYGTQFTVNNPTHAHGTFAGWNITGMSSGTHTIGGSSVSGTSATGVTATTFNNLHTTQGATVTFTAVWTCATGYTGDDCTANTYTITYAAGGHGTAPTGTTTCSYGSTFHTKPAITGVTGYTFNKWTVNNKTLDPDTDVVCNNANLGATGGALTLTGTWTTNSYDIIYKDEDGETVLTDLTPANYPTSYTYGTSTTITTIPTKIYSVFNGWCTGFSNGAPTDCTNPNNPPVIGPTATGNKTFYASWSCATGYTKYNFETYTHVYNGGSSGEWLHAVPDR